MFCGGFSKKKKKHYHPHSPFTSPFCTLFSDLTSLLLLTSGQLCPLFETGQFHVPKGGQFKLYQVRHSSLKWTEKKNTGV